MSETSDARLGLVEFLVELQAELSDACLQAEKDDLRFSVDGVTLEVDVSYTLTQSAESRTRLKPKFWVFGLGPKDAKDGAGSAHRNMQHLIVRLTPRPEEVPEDFGAVAILPPKPLPDIE